MKMTKTDGKLPGFLIIGAQKCGTSWLHQQLRGHPQLYLPPGKELEFFSYAPHLTDPGIDAYRAAFAEAGDRLAGEATPSYFWTHSHTAWCRQPEGFQEHIPAVVRDALGPDLRLILSLRDPAQRALSAWGHYLAHGELEARLPFREAARYGGIIDMGFYGRHLERWLQHFPLQQFLVLSLERDIQQEPRGTLERCETFLGVPVTGGNPLTARDRVFPGPTRRAVDGGLNILIPALGTVTLSDADLAWLDALYTEDQQLLKRLLNPAH